MLIIPRTPSPLPLEERDITTLTPDELRELQRRARAARVRKVHAAAGVPAELCRNSYAARTKPKSR